MKTPESQNPHKPRSRLPLLVLALLLPVVIVGLIKDLWFDPNPAPSPKLIHGCKPKDWDCIDANPPPMPDWNIPTDPQQRAAYDHAHALELPDGVPQPVPFDFRAARIASLEGGKAVGEQYFEHLCATENGNYILHTVENVEGVYLLRPRADQRDSPPDFDRYGTEDPSGIAGGDHSDLQQNPQGENGLPEFFIQPLGGRYLYLEQPDWDHPGQLARFVRRLNPDPPYGKDNGVETFQSGTSLRLPYFVVRESAPAAERQARYGITWRGIRRPRDRDFNIAGGELLALDLETNEVLAIRRVFVRAGQYMKQGIWWANSRHCGQGLGTPYLSTKTSRFAPNVFRPLPHVNDDMLQHRINFTYGESQ